MRPELRAKEVCAVWRPCWSTFHSLGIAASALLPVNRSYVEIANHFGISPQNAYHECMVALGKVVFELRKLSDKSTD